MVFIDSRPLERFQAKWKPVRRPETREIKTLDHFRVSKKHGNGLVALASIAAFVAAILFAVTVFRPAGAAVTPAVGRAASTA